MVERNLIAITGASGAIYAKKLLVSLLEAGEACDLVASSPGLSVCRHEIGSEPKDWINSKKVNRTKNRNVSAVRLYSENDMTAPFISGSAAPKAMIVIPCSMATLGRIASGVSENVIARTADVCIKERRRLILVVRETPLSLIHLENMVKVTQAGGIILPAAPGFYHKPETIDDLTYYIIGKVMDILGIRNNAFKRWGEGWREPS